MDKIKIFLVDNSIEALIFIEKVFSNDDNFEIIGTARDGEDAIKKIPQAKPDAVILDTELPKLDGIEVIKYLVRNFPVPILVFSSSVHEEAQTINIALIEGALDFALKPEYLSDDNINSIRKELIEKTKIVSHVKVIKKIDIKPVKRTKIKKKEIIDIRKIIVIGASTGGPRVLDYILSSLPKRMNTPIIIAQHMPDKFTKILADQIDKNSHYQIKEAERGEKIQYSTAYIGKGEHNFIINNDYTFSIFPAERTALPSIDIMFESAAKIFHNKVIGVILTGMGRDGLIGAEKIKENGGIIITESEESAMIFGMPNAVIDKNLADYIYHYKDIPKLLSKLT